MSLVQEQLLSMSIAVLMLHIPYVSRVMKTLATLVHEFGHALCNMILSVKVKRIELRYDTSGLTYYQSSRKWVRFLTSLCGYPAPSALAFAMAILISRDFEAAVVIGMIILIAFNTLLFIRNAYGLIWALLFMGALAALAYLQWLPYHMIASFLLTILLYEGISSCIGLIRICLQKNVPSCDATVLRELTYLPAWFWAFVFLSFNLLLTYCSLQTLAFSGYFGDWLMSHWPSI